MSESKPGAPLRGCRIEADELARRFGDHVALDSVTLAIEPGETFGLLGANGAGKTTFIRLLTGYLVPSAGSVRVDGLSPIRDARTVHARMGFAAETSRIYPELRVRGFLRFAAGARGLAASEREAAVERILARFGLEEVAQRIVGNLSKGFQQRVSLAQAFLHDPALLIVDEPTSGLDPLQREDIRAQLAQARGQRTVVLGTHDLAADRVAVLRAGRLVALGATEDVLGSGDPLALFRPDAEASP